MTTDIDSIVPSSHSFKTMTQTTLMIITPTHNIEIIACIKLPVENNKTVKAKKIAKAIPCKADLTNAFSVGMKAQMMPASWTTVLSSLGALSFQSSKND